MFDIMYRPFWSVFLEVLTHEHFGRRYLYETHKGAFALVIILGIATLADPLIKTHSMATHIFLILTAVRAVMEALRTFFGDLKEVHGDSWGVYWFIPKSRALEPIQHAAIRYGESWVWMLLGIGCIVANLDLIFGSVIGLCGASLMQKAKANYTALTGEKITIFNAPKDMKRRSDYAKEASGHDTAHKPHKARIESEANKRS